MDDRMEKGPKKNIAENRKARHDYHIEEVFEAGLVLKGTEVKSLRQGRVNLKDSYARIKNGEVYYRYGGRTQKIQYAELESIINRRIQQNNQQWLDLVQKIGATGPSNAAIPTASTEMSVVSRNTRGTLRCRVSSSFASRGRKAPEIDWGKIRSRSADATPTA